MDLLTLRRVLPRPVAGAASWPEDLPESAVAPIGGTLALDGAEHAQGDRELFRHNAANGAAERQVSATNTNHG